ARMNRGISAISRAGSPFVSIRFGSRLDTRPWMLVTPRNITGAPWKCATCSRTCGKARRHGPHHVAQKSMTTIWPLSADSVVRPAVVRRSDLQRAGAKLLVDRRVRDDRQLGGGPDRPADFLPQKRGIARVVGMH